MNAYPELYNPGIFFFGYHIKYTDSIQYYIADL